LTSPFAGTVELTVETFVSRARNAVLPVAAAVDAVAVAAAVAGEPAGPLACELELRLPWPNSATAPTAVKARNGCLGTIDLSSVGFDGP
jgi:hypothetical protein